MRTHRHALSAVLILALTALCLLHVQHDAAPSLEIAAFVPIWPLAALAVAWDVALRGDALPVRWLMSAFGLVYGGLSLGTAIAPAVAPEAKRDASTLQLLHWNTQWGGATQTSLERQLDTIATQDADVVCLSEAPASAWLAPAWRARRPDYHSASVEDPSFAT